MIQFKRSLCAFGVMAALSLSTAAAGEEDKAEGEREPLQFSQEESQKSAERSAQAIEHLTVDLYVPPRSRSANTGEPQMLRDLKDVRDWDGTDAERRSSSLRMSAIESAARTAGIQGGLKWRTDQITEEVMSLEEVLDEVYEFDSLMIKSRNHMIKPPVITDANSITRITDSGQTLRIASKTFRILSEPRFVTHPPDWRNYLILPVPEPRSVHRSLRPTSKSEHDAWVRGAEKGWAEGVAQAEEIFQLQVARLSRDLHGMITYHILRSHNMVTEPIVDQNYNPVSGGGDQMAISDRIMTIEVSPNLNPDQSSWEAVPRLPDIERLYPPSYRMRMMELSRSQE
ncbi:MULTISPECIES: type IV secretory system conjugative DNA transfer family protein [unclassified Thioalkalivibrio]|uniref:type IV secretory system conjugative DNA transfer family protein n=1 Tax=unclassified Thioalkalivibrio TaxID=2621013 RepID=UPI000378E9D2|nr:MULTISPECIES: type IV secretory system conjugative DNA transfer family protein [unclassified Thioalkalivibrio]